MSDSPTPLNHASVDSPSDRPSADDITIIPDRPQVDAPSQRTQEQAAADASVQALLDDLAYVSTQIPPEQRPEAAQAVLAHHHPPIDEALLSAGMRSRQREAIRLLRQLSGQIAASAQAISDDPQTSLTTAMVQPRPRWSLKHLSRTVLIAVALAVIGLVAGRVIHHLT